MKNEASSAARKRYLHVFFQRGGEANVRRVKQAIALRDRIARRLDFDNWAAYQLDTKMAKTPSRALALLHEVDTRLLPRARAELATLAALKARQGDPTEKLLARKHAADGIFWTRQAFLAVYDLTIHSSGAKVDTTRLWFSLMPQLTPLPPPAGTIPDASFLPIMGGYDAGYYGYVWSRVYAQDMFTAFQKGGLENPEVGLRYRREILEPGGTVEPEDLLSNFLGRPVRSDAFYEDLDIDM